ncbi:MAG: TolC family protein, partial [Bacteroidetes bacterium]
PVLYTMVESGRRQRRKPRLYPAVIALLVATGSFGITQVHAQDTSISLEEAVEAAVENYPSLKAASVEIERQRALRPAALDLGNTRVYTGSEEVGNGLPGIRNQVGVVQSGIDLLGIPAKDQLNRAGTELAVSGYALAERELVRDVSISWYRAFAARKQWELYVQLDSVYAGFLKAAELRHKTQETSRIEFLAASAKYKELVVSLTRARSEYSAALEVLNRYLVLQQGFDIDTTGPEVPNDLATLPGWISDAPPVRFYQDLATVARAEWKVERASLLPKFEFGYTRQSVDGERGFYGWETGISMPLPFNSQLARTKAAKLNAEIARHDLREIQLEIESSYRELLTRYRSVAGMLEYYQAEALPLAEEQIEAANLGYRLGSIDYVQFIQNVESAMNTRQEYLRNLENYFVIKEQLEYLTGI